MDWIENLGGGGLDGTSAVVDVNRVIELDQDHWNSIDFVQIFRVLDAVVNDLEKYLVSHDVTSVRRIWVLLEQLLCHKEPVVRTKVLHKIVEAIQRAPTCFAVCDKAFTLDFVDEIFDMVHGDELESNRILAVHILGLLGRGRIHNQDVGTETLSTQTMIFQRLAVIVGSQFSASFCISERQRPRFFPFVEATTSTHKLLIAVFDAICTLLDGDSPVDMKFMNPILYMISELLSCDEQLSEFMAYEMLKLLNAWTEYLLDEDKKPEEEEAKKDGSFDGNGGLSTDSMGGFCALFTPIVEKLLTRFSDKRLEKQILRFLGTWMQYFVNMDKLEISMRSVEIPLMGLEQLKVMLPEQNPIFPSYQDQLGSVSKQRDDMRAHLRRRIESIRTILQPPGTAARLTCKDDTIPSRSMNLFRTEEAEVMGLDQISMYIPASNMGVIRFAISQPSLPDVPEGCITVPPVLFPEGTPVPPITSKLLERYPGIHQLFELGYLPYPPPRRETTEVVANNIAAEEQRFATSLDQFDVGAPVFGKTLSPEIAEKYSEYKNQELVDVNDLEPNQFGYVQNLPSGFHGVPFHQYSDITPIEKSKLTNKEKYQDSSWNPPQRANDLLMGSSGGELLEPISDYTMLTTELHDNEANPNDAEVVQKRRGSVSSYARNEETVLCLPIVSAYHELDKASNETMYNDFPLKKYGAVELWIFETPEVPIRRFTLQILSIEPTSQSSDDLVEPSPTDWEIGSSVEACVRVSHGQQQFVVTFEVVQLQQDEEGLEVYYSSIGHVDLPQPIPAGKCRNGSVIFAPPVNFPPIPIRYEEEDGTAVYGPPKPLQALPCAYLQDGTPLYPTDDPEPIDYEKPLGYSNSGYAFFRGPYGVLPKPIGFTHHGIPFYSAVAIACNPLFPYSLRRRSLARKALRVAKKRLQNKTKRLMMLSKSIAGGSVKIKSSSGLAKTLGKRKSSKMFSSLTNDKKAKSMKTITETNRDTLKDQNNNVAVDKIQEAEDEEEEEANDLNPFQEDEFGYIQIDVKDMDELADILSSSSDEDDNDDDEEGQGFEGSTRKKNKIALEAQDDEEDANNFMKELIAERQSPDASALNSVLSADIKLLFSTTQLIFTASTAVETKTIKISPEILLDTELSAFVVVEPSQVFDVSPSILHFQPETRSVNIEVTFKPMQHPEPSSQVSGLVHVQTFAGQILASCELSGFRGPVIDIDETTFQTLWAEPGDKASISLGLDNLTGNNVKLDVQVFADPRGGVVEKTVDSISIVTENLQGMGSLDGDVFNPFAVQQSKMSLHPFQESSINVTFLPGDQAGLHQATLEVTTSTGEKHRFQLMAFCGIPLRVREPRFEEDTTRADRIGRRGSYEERKASAVWTSGGGVNGPKRHTEKRTSTILASMNLKRTPTLALLASNPNVSGQDAKVAPGGGGPTKSTTAKDTLMNIVSADERERKGGDAAKWKQVKKMLGSVTRLQTLTNKNKKKDGFTTYVYDDPTARPKEDLAYVEESLSQSILDFVSKRKICSPNPELRSRVLHADDHRIMPGDKSVTCISSSLTLDFGLVNPFQHVSRKFAVDNLREESVVVGINCESELLFRVPNHIIVPGKETELVEVTLAGQNGLEGPLDTSLEIFSPVLQRNQKISMVGYLGRALEIPVGPRIYFPPSVIGETQTVTVPVINHSQYPIRFVFLPFSDGKVFSSSIGSDVNFPMEIPPFSTIHVPFEFRASNRRGIYRSTLSIQVIEPVQCTYAAPGSHGVVDMIGIVMNLVSDQEQALSLDLNRVDQIVPWIKGTGNFVGLAGNTKSHFEKAMTSVQFQAFYTKEKKEEMINISEICDQIVDTPKPGRGSLSWKSLYDEKLTSAELSCRSAEEASMEMALKGRSSFATSKVTFMAPTGLHLDRKDNNRDTIELSFMVMKVRQAGLHYMFATALEMDDEKQQLLSMCSMGVCVTGVEQYLVMPRQHNGPMLDFSRCLVGETKLSYLVIRSFCSRPTKFKLQFPTDLPYGYRPFCIDESHMKGELEPFQSVIVPCTFSPEAQSVYQEMLELLVYESDEDKLLQKVQHDDELAGYNNSNSNNVEKEEEKDEEDVMYINPTQIPLKGSGYQVMLEGLFEPQEVLEFGNTLIDTKHHREIPLYNEGISTETIICDVSPPFYVEPGQFKIEPEESKILTVTFHPQKRGSYSSKIHLLFGGKSITGILEGFAGTFAPLSTSKDNVINFGQRRIGKVYTAKLYITNGGTLPISLKYVSFDAATQQLYPCEKSKASVNINFLGIMDQPNLGLLDKVTEQSSGWIILKTNLAKAVELTKLSNTQQMSASGKNKSRKANRLSAMVKSSFKASDPTQILNLLRSSGLNSSSTNVTKSFHASRKFQSMKTRGSVQNLIPFHSAKQTGITGTSAGGRGVAGGKPGNFGTLKLRRSGTGKMNRMGSKKMMEELMESFKSTTGNTSGGKGLRLQPFDPEWNETKKAEYERFQVDLPPLMPGASWAFDISYHASQSVSIAIPLAFVCQLYQSYSVATDFRVGDLTMDNPLLEKLPLTVRGRGIRGLDFSIRTLDYGPVPAKMFFPKQTAGKSGVVKYVKVWNRSISVQTLTYLRSTSTSFFVDADEDSFDLEPGMEIEVPIRFQPKQARKEYYAELLFKDQFMETSIDVSGFGAAAHVQCSVTEVHYDAIKCGKPQSFSFNIENIGQLPSLCEVSCESEFFIIDSKRQFRLEPEGGLEVGTIICNTRQSDKSRFQEVMGGEITAQVTLRWQVVPEGVYQTISLPIKANVGEIKLAMEDPPEGKLDLGILTLGYPSEGTITLRNDGTVDCDWKFESYPNQSWFYYDKVKGVIPPNGGKQVVAFKITPATCDPIDEVVELKSDGGDLMIPICGSVVAPKLVVPEQLDFDFGVILPGQTIRKVLKLHNPGLARINYGMTIFLHDQNLKGTRKAMAENLLTMWNGKKADDESTLSRAERLIQKRLLEGWRNKRNNKYNNDGVDPAGDGGNNDKNSDKIQGKPSESDPNVLEVTCFRLTPFQGVLESESDLNLVLEAYATEEVVSQVQAEAQAFIGSYRIASSQLEQFWEGRLRAKFGVMKYKVLAPHSSILSRDDKQHLSQEELNTISYFGVYMVNMSFTKSNAIVVKNEGTVDLECRIVLEPSDPKRDLASFSLNVLKGVVAPGCLLGFDAEFHSKSEGFHKRLAEVRISASNASVEKTKLEKVLLCASGGRPLLLCETTHVDFGRRQVDETHYQHFWIQSAGNCPVTWSIQIIDDANNYDSHAAFSVNVKEGILDAQNDHEVVIGFNPPKTSGMDLISYRAIMLIEWAGQKPFEILLEGEGGRGRLSWFSHFAPLPDELEINAKKADDRIVDFGVCPIYQGSEMTWETIVIQNTGTLDVDVCISTNLPSSVFIVSRHEELGRRKEKTMQINRKFAEAKNLPEVDLSALEMGHAMALQQVAKSSKLPRDGVASQGGTTANGLVIIEKEAMVEPEEELLLYVGFLPDTLASYDCIIRVDMIKLSRTLEIPVRGKGGDLELLVPQDDKAILSFDTLGLECSTLTNIRLCNEGLLDTNVEVRIYPPSLGKEVSIVSSGKPDVPVTQASIPIPKSDRKASRTRGDSSLLEELHEEKLALQQQNEEQQQQLDAVHWVEIHGGMLHELNICIHPLEQGNREGFIVFSPVDSGLPGDDSNDDLEMFLSNKMRAMVQKKKKAMTEPQKLAGRFGCYIPIRYQAVNNRLRLSKMCDFCFGRVPFGKSVREVRKLMNTTEMDIPFEIQFSWPDGDGLSYEEFWSIEPRRGLVYPGDSVEFMVEYISKDERTSCWHTVEISLLNKATNFVDFSFRASGSVGYPIFNVNTLQEVIDFGPCQIDKFIYVPIRINNPGKGMLHVVPRFNNKIKVEDDVEVERYEDEENDLFYLGWDPTKTANPDGDPERMDTADSRSSTRPKSSKSDGTSNRKSLALLLNKRPGSKKKRRVVLGERPDDMTGPSSMMSGRATRQSFRIRPGASNNPNASFKAGRHTSFKLGAPKQNGKDGEAGLGNLNEDVAISNDDDEDLDEESKAQAILTRPEKVELSLAVGTDDSARKYSRAIYGIISHGSGHGEGISKPIFKGYGVLAQNDHVDFMVVFAPTMEGLFSATLSFETNLGTTHTYKVIGRGVHYSLRMEILPNSLEMGSLVLGESKSRPVAFSKTSIADVPVRFMFDSIPKPLEWLPPFGFAGVIMSEGVVNDGDDENTAKAVTSFEPKMVNFSQDSITVGTKVEQININVEVPKLWLDKNGVPTQAGAAHIGAILREQPIAPAMVRQPCYVVCPGQWPFFKIDVKYRIEVPRIQVRLSEAQSMEEANDRHVKIRDLAPKSTRSSPSAQGESEDGVGAVIDFGSVLTLTEVSRSIILSSNSRLKIPFQAQIVVESHRNSTENYSAYFHLSRKLGTVVQETPVAIKLRCNFDKTFDSNQVPVCLRISFLYGQLPDVIVPVHIRTMPHVFDGEKMSPIHFEEPVFVGSEVIKHLTLRNVSGDMISGNISFGAPVFSVTSDMNPVSLRGEEEKVIPVKFKPKEDRRYDTHMDIRVGDLIFSLNVSGIGCEPTLKLRPEKKIDFGFVGVMLSGYKELTVRNTCVLPIYVKLSGLPEEYEVSPREFLLKPKASKSARIVFTPKKERICEGVLSVIGYSCENSETGKTQIGKEVLHYAVEIIGHGGRVALDLPSELDFGSISTHIMQQMFFTVTNSGDVAMDLELVAPPRTERGFLKLQPQAISLLPTQSVNVKLNLVVYVEKENEFFIEIAPQGSGDSQVPMDQRTWKIPVRAFGDKIQLSQEIQRVLDEEELVVLAPMSDDIEDVHVQHVLKPITNLHDVSVAHLTATIQPSFARDGDFIKSELRPPPPLAADPDNPLIRRWYENRIPLSMSAQAGGGGASYAFKNSKWQDLIKKTTTPNDENNGTK